MTFPIVATSFDDAGRVDRAESWPGRRSRSTPRQVEELLDDEPAAVARADPLPALPARGRLAGVADGGGGGVGRSGSRRGCPGWWSPTALYDKLQAAVPRAAPRRASSTASRKCNYPIVAGRGAAAGRPERHRQAARADEGLRPGCTDGADSDADTGKALRRVYDISEKELVAGDVGDPVQCTTEPRGQRARPSKAIAVTASASCPTSTGPEGRYHSTRELIIPKRSRLTSSGSRSARRAPSSAAWPTSAASRASIRRRRRQRGAARSRCCRAPAAAG